MFLIVLAATWAAACGRGVAVADHPGVAVADHRGPAVERTEILWDTYGVPHIFARDAEELFYAYGWAQAEAHGDLLLGLYGQARGRAAEYWGGEYLNSDRWVRTMGIPARATRWYEAQAPRFRAYLDAFARGVNEYARAHPDRLADERKVVLPLTGEDVMAHVQRTVHFTFVASPWTVDATRRRWAEGGSAGAARAGVEATEATAQLGPEPGGREDRLEVARAGLGASNAWAIGPSRAADGHAMLLANPHLPWADLFTWFEVQLASPEIDAYGATLVGSPFLGIAFNDDLGWTHTVNAHDGADFYELRLVEEGYRWGEGTREFEVEADTIRVRQRDGGLAAEPIELRASVHGPVVATRDDRALALRMVGLDEPQLFAQYWEMARARNLEEFEAAVARLQMPTFTVMYADREGNILHLFGGRVPVRPEGDWSWSGVVPGVGPETLWQETHRYEELPRVLNPETGWLQNANDPPWTTTFPSPLDPGAFPDYMAPREPLAPRSQRSARMLAGDGAITFEELVAYKHSTRMELADRIVDDLVAAAETRGGETARRAAAVLREWDRRAEADSRGAVLFEAFHEQIRSRRWPDGFYAEPWDPERPFETPGGLVDPEAAVAALEAAAREVETAHGRLDPVWGELHRLRRDGLDLLGSGGSGLLGIFRVVDYDEAEGGRHVAVGGDSFVAAVEFGDSVRARALIGYGNSSRRGSPHRTDQMRHFARGELRPVWRTRAAIEAHLERRESLAPGGESQPRDVP